MRSIKFTCQLVLISFIVACGGSGGGSPATFTLSGKVYLGDNITYDTDNNDIENIEIANNSFADAQTIESFAEVNGFVSAIPTYNSEDRFANSFDIEDYYRAKLYKDQVIRLQFFHPSTSSTKYTGDVDIQLFDITNTTMQVGVSVSDLDQEEVTVPADGDYYIVIKALSGYSRYALVLNDSLIPNSFNFQKSTSQYDFVPNQLIVKFKSQANINTFNKKAGFQLKHTDIERATLVNFDADMNISASKNISLFNKLDKQAQQKYLTKQKLKEFQQRSDVEYASLNYIYKTHQLAPITPNDPAYIDQWHYENIKLPNAWAVVNNQSSLNDVVVAVIDTGVYLDHPDLDAKLIDGYDFINDVEMANDGDGMDSNPDDPGNAKKIEESNWHGTHVAGTIAAETDNTQGVAGVSWNAKIMPLRALGVGGGTSYEVMQAVRYAAGLTNDSGTTPAQAADIINLSLGGGGPSMAAAALYKQVYDMGIVVVASAGNDALNYLAYPASYPGVFSVSATDINDDLSSYSNYGPNIDLAAPGGDSNGTVLSTYVDASSGQRVASYDYLRGTSMAAPHVSGVFALMKSINSGLQASDINALLQNGDLTNDMGSTGRDDDYGFGLMDAKKAVDQAVNSLNSSIPSLSSVPVIATTPAPLYIEAEAGQVYAAKNSFYLSHQYGAVPSNIVVTSSNTILQVTPTSDVVNGLGEYELSLDASGLSKGVYSETITVDYQYGSTPTNASQAFNIRLYIGELDTLGEVSKMVARLVDVDADKTIMDVPLNSDFSFEFTNIPKGNYQVFAGTDIDNDGYVCSQAEVCGAYPYLIDRETILLDKDTDQIDIYVNMLSAFSLYP